MSRSKYLTHLEAKGYKILNENQVSLGTLVFNVQVKVQNTAMGEQTTLCLKLTKEV